MIVDLIDEKSEILKQTLEPFDFEKDDAEKLAGLLIKNMEYYQGLGLSANQIGMNKRVFAMLDQNKNSVAIFNPKIIETSEEMVVMPEGCLSYLGLYIKIRRPRAVVAEYYDINGVQQVFALDGLPARTFLHEYDHLNGVRFIDVASKVYLQSGMQKRKMFIRQLMKDHRNQKKMLDTE